MPSYAFYASQESYRRHVDPIAAELHQRGHTLVMHSSLPGAPWGLPEPDALIVASGIDAQRVQAAKCPVVYVEHGAGQTYIDADRDGFGYAGGPGLDHVGLFLAPSERVAGRWRNAYPGAEVAVIGCPALDWAVSCRRGGRLGALSASSTSVQSGSLDAHERGSIPLAASVTVTSHWNCGASPEAFPALPYFMGAIPQLRDHLAEQGIELVGHAHPRIARRLAEDWRNLGIRYESDPDVILATASLLIADNTSLLFEACAVGLPTLCLNSPQYRREIEHGGRFWRDCPGPQCGEPAALQRAVMHALDDGPDDRALREKAARWAYDRPLDGQASARAADAILAMDPTPKRGARMSEVRGHLDEMLDRLRQLGATDEEVEEFAQTWDAKGPEVREMLRRMNDTLLAQEIVHARESE